MAERIVFVSKKKRRIGREGFCKRDGEYRVAERDGELIFFFFRRKKKRKKESYNEKGTFESLERW